MHIAPLIQTAAFDVADWEADAEFGVFPQGARAKDAVFAPATPSEPVLVGGKRYLFKRSKRSYPDQFWGEVIGYRVGCLMGLQVPPAFAAFNSRTGHSAALIEWFYRDGAEVFMLGGDFMQMVRKGFDRDRGTQHNLQDVELLLRVLAQTSALLQSWRQWWVDALLFDALIGNSDRHQDNWGLIFSMTKEEPPALPRFRLAPLFDNGTSLGHERFPERVTGWSDARLDQYIANGTHHIKWSLRPGAVVQSHLALLRHALFHWREHIDRDLLRRRVAFSGNDLIECIADLLQVPIPVALTTERMQFVFRLLVRRHALLKALLNEPSEPPG
jgi:HipA-like C-terminal domain